MQDTPRKPQQVTNSIMNACGYCIGTTCLVHLNNNLLMVWEYVMVTTNLAKEVLISAEFIKVHILDSINGSYTTYWTIPDDISAEDAEKWIDPASGILYATTIYEAGEPETYLALSGKGLDIDTSLFD